MTTTSLVPAVSSPSEGKTGKALAVEKSLDMAKAVLTHPFYSIILGCALVELLQTIMIDDPSKPDVWVSQPGTHALRLIHQQKPLISDKLGNTIQTDAFILGAIKELGGLASIVGLFKGG